MTESGPGLLLCDVRGVPPDAVTVDALAQLQLAARRVAARSASAMRRARPLDLVALMGLTDVLAD